ncbi:MAG: hypothetical protein Q6373_011065 [Candidatus Sigynarchaeota archaeon]
MPGTAHIVFNLGLSLFLYKATRGKFSIKHAIIFTVNSLVGPDMFGFLDWGNQAYWFFHGYGWIVAAIPLAFAWSIFTKFSLQWVPFKVTKRDPAKEAIITIPEVFCLVAAGGLLHLFIDIIGHPPTASYPGGPYDIPWGAIWFGNDWWFSMDSILATGRFPCGNYYGYPEYLPYLVSVLAITLLLMMFVMQRSSKHFQIASVIVILAGIAPLLIAFVGPLLSGSEPMAYHLTGGEADLGVDVFIGLFFFVPLVLLWMSYDGIPFVKKHGLRAAIERIEAEERASAKQRIAEVVAAAKSRG